MFGSVNGIKAIIDEHRNLLKFCYYVFKPLMIVAFFLIHPITHTLPFIYVQDNLELLVRLFNYLLDFFYYLHEVLYLPLEQL